MLLPHGLVVDRVEKLAEDIRRAYPDSTPHMLVVLKGGSEFATDLTRTLRRLHTYRFNAAVAAAGAAPPLPFTVDYVRVKSYEGTSSTGNVRISGIDMKTLAGRDIIVVEDIIDTGLTMTRLLPELGRHGIKSVRVAALLEKRTEKSCGFKADFVGFSVPDAFVVRAGGLRARGARARLVRPDGAPHSQRPPQVGYNLDFNEAFREMPHICIISQPGIDHFKSHPLLQGLL